MIDELADEYEEFVRPRNFFEGWSVAEFIDWCNMAEDEDELWWTYLALYDDEMYFYADIVIWLLSGDGQDIKKYGQLNVQNYS